ncbi:DUF2975 domain-containing protein [Hyphomonas pacifica]|uniref:DUF2975 domain-containing protein n=1 Tax=Hyphomonas pacifica TaxID=1280941 RepID=A0A8B2PKA8_9PROT|nr:DUF2975 domain-containing protein [Hyphomonas pacifica]RAN33480.1 hypothetical protein HY3_13085 [Hyphomonas pacifica]RAN36454.1 hypothetical protein HY11_01665 [Hyphomonas pacifica]
MSTNAGNSMAAIMTVLVTIVMWMTALIGAIVIIAGSVELISMLSGNPISIGSVTVDNHDITVPELTAGLIGAVVVVAAVVFVCMELRKILATLAAGDPFVPENAVRLTRIAIAIAVTQLMRYAIALIIGLMVKGTRIELSFDLIAWASVAALFILSQVFREGTRLRDEEKMTI